MNVFRSRTLLISHKDGKETVGGIGEEDMVTLVLPYVHTAKEGAEA